MKQRKGGNRNHCKTEVIVIGSQRKIQGFRVKIDLTTEARKSLKEEGKIIIFSPQTEENYCENHRVVAFFLPFQDSGKILSSSQGMKKWKGQLETCRKHPPRVCGVSKPGPCEVEKKPEDPQADCYHPAAVTATAVCMKTTVMLSSWVMWFLLRK